MRAGDLEMVDLGTVFEVRRDGAAVRVAVAEGTVLVDPAGAAVRLDPGQAAVSGGGTISRLSTPAEDVGAWSDGRLAFDGVPLSEVAGDLSRHLGRRITVAPSIAKRPVLGTLYVEQLRREPSLLASVLDVRVRRRGEDWTLEPRR